MFQLRHPDGSARFYFGIAYGRNYDISPDGRRFLMLELLPEPPHHAGEHHPGLVPGTAAPGAEWIRGKGNPTPELAPRMLK
jgi:hypothetical protein